MALGQSSLESAFYMFDFHKKKGICKQVWDSTVHWFRFREKKIPFTIDETLSTEVWKKKNKACICIIQSILLLNAQQGQ